MLLQAQTPVVFEEWSANKGVQEFFYKNVTVTDVSNNVYVAGATLNEDGNYDLLISKFDKYGNQLWSNTVAGLGNGHDMASDIKLGSGGRVYVSGTISTSSEGNNMLLLCYDTDGDEQWRYSHDYDNQEEGAVAICVDGDNNVYLTGTTYSFSNLSSDMLTIKVSNSGSLVWEQTYDHNYLLDTGVKIALSGPRAVVTGVGQTGLNTFVIVALSYMQNNGSLSGSSTSGSTSQSMEEASDLFVDEDNNVYIAGSVLNTGNGYDFKLIKLNENLNIVWVKEWDGEGLNDRAKGVKVDAGGNVYLCGTTATASNGDDMVLIKYNAAGTQKWVRTYNGQYNGNDQAEALEYHPDGYIYMAGSSYVVSNMDYLTIKYDTTGATQWHINYNSPYNKNDRATNMAIDNDGDIIVTGQCERDSVLKTYYAVKYVEKNVVPSSINEPANDIISFEKNMGQIRNHDDSSPNPNVLFYTEKISNPVFYQNDRISVLTHNYNGDTLAADTLDRFDIKIDKYNNNLKCRAFGKTEFYTNYFSNANSFPITRNNHFKFVYYEDVWTNTDLVNFIKGNGALIFQLVCAPQTNMSTFDFELEGIVGVAIDSLGMLEIHTSVQMYRLTKPIAYSISGNDTLHLQWQPYWSINTSGRPELIINPESFPYMIDFETYTPSILHECVEDYYLNNCVWSTYFGVPSNFYLETIRSVELDSENNLFILMETKKQVNSPLIFLNDLTPQYYEPVFQNLAGIIYTQLIKFNPNHEPEWLTMYYGDKDTEPKDMVAFGSSIYFTGNTKASNLYTINAHQESYGSDLTNLEDGFVVKADTWGILEWSTYIGGQGKEEIVAIDVDNDNRIFLAGKHTPIAIGDNLNQIALNGAYNHSSSFTPQSFICGFQEYNPFWLTFLGDTGAEDWVFTSFVSIEDLKIVQNRLVVVGTVSNLMAIDDNSTSGLSTPITESIYFPLGAPPSAYFENVYGEGRQTGFITEFDASTLAILWSTMIAGNSAFENALKIDGKSIVGYTYVVGLESRSSTMNFMDPNGGFSGFYQNYNAAENSGDHVSAVIVKFKDRELVWGTYYGGIFEEKIQHIFMDNDLNIFFGGYTATPDLDPTECQISQMDGGLPFCSSNNSYFVDPTYNHGLMESQLDGFIGAFNFNNELIWSTHIGSAYTMPNGIYEGVSSMAFDPLYYELYVVGGSHGSCFPTVDFPQSAAYFQDTYNGGGGDGFIAKFDFSNLLISTNINPIDNFHNDYSTYFIFPNPGKDELSVSSKENLPFNLRILDINGRVLYQSINGYQYNVRISTAHFGHGMYFVQILDAQNSQTLKWIKH
jgi:hypothetical protein